MHRRELLKGAAAVGLAIVGARARAAVAGRLVYIGTYTGGPSKGIYAFRFDEGSGALMPLGLAAETANPSFLTSAGNTRLFAVNELDSFEGQPSGSVTSFAIDAATGKLTSIDVQATRGKGACHLALDRSGRFLAVANYGGGNFALFPVDRNGRLQPAVTVVAGDGPPTATRLGHMVGFDARNRFLVTADKGLDRLLVFRFDAARGALTPAAQPSAALPAGSGPRHFAFHPNGRWLFAISEQAATVTTFLWDAASGRLTAAGSVPTRPADVTTGTTAEIAVHPNGRFVYGSNRGHDSIAAFAVGAGGALRLVEYQPTRGQTPRNFAIDPTGRWLIAANQRSNTLAVFAVDQQSGTLAPVGPLVDVGSPVCVLFVD
jgi:6-phosphogluconolactonase